MKFKLLIICMLIIPNVCWSVEKTSTGFYYPTNRSSLPSDKFWLSSGCNDNNSYYDNEYHIGYDFLANLNDKVYLIADGVVSTISYNGWGDGNVAVIVKHRLSNGAYFLALYGHIITDVTVGQKVYAGQELGKIGYWSNGNHLHFGIVPGFSMPGNPWGRMPCSSWPSTNGFVDPINWITTYYPYVNVVGYYPDGFHDDGTSQAFVNSFNRLSPKIGWPSDNGGGVYVHTWVSSHDSRYKTDVQDYQGGDQSMLILNVLSSPYQANWVKGGFCYLYRISDGPFSFGIAYTEEITHNYATSPISTAIDPIQPGDCVTVQKFQQVYYIGTTLNAGQRQTMVWKNGINAQHFPIGEYAIYPESCSGVCPREGDQMSIMDNNHASDASYDKPWPKAGIKVPTGVWFTKPGTYQFVLHNADGTRKSGWGLTVQITEGNHQFSGNSNTIDTTVTVTTPVNLSATAVTQTEIDLSWTGNNEANPVEYRVYRKLSGASGETIYIGSTSSTNFSDTYLNPGTSYCYQISAAYGGLESSKSALVCGQTLSGNTANILSVPQGIAAFVMSANQISLRWEANPESGTVYEVYQDDVLAALTELTSQTFSDLSPGTTYRFRIRATNYNNDFSGYSSYVVATTLAEGTGSISSDWYDTDVGNASIIGSAYYNSSNNRYTIKGTGNGLDDNLSQCTYLYQSHSDCANISTHLISNTLTNPKAMAGIMIMETTDPNSNYVLVAATQNQGLIFQYKQYGVVTKVGSEYYDFPVYLRMGKNRDKFVAQYSFTGNASEWITIGTANLNFANPYQVGLFATPGNSSSVSTTIFENLSLTSNPFKVSGLRIQ